jgi:hypothetical protein
MLRQIEIYKIGRNLILNMKLTTEIKKILKNKIIINLTIFISILLLSCILSDGYLGGDELAINRIVVSYVQSNLSLYDFIRVNPQSRFYLNHHFLWFIFQLGMFNISDLFFNSLTKNAIILNWIQVLPLSVFATCSVLNCFLWLKKNGFSIEIILISLILFYFGSSICCLLTGGFVECFLIFAISMRMLIISEDNKINLILLIALDFLIIASKAYAIILIIILIPILNQKIKSKLLIKYVLILFLMLLFWSTSKFILFEFNQSNLEIYDDPLFNNLQFSIVFFNFINSIFSFRYGLLFSCPLLLFLIITTCLRDPVLVIKVSALVFLQLFFCFFSFWHGASGFSGQRYLIPFLVILVPEFTGWIKYLVDKKNALVFFFYMLILINLPVIDYRNTLASSQDDTKWNVTNYIDFLSNYDYQFEPHFYAWRLIISEQTSNYEVLRRSNTSLALLTSVPMTGISRLIIGTNDKIATLDKMQYIKELIPSYYHFFILGIKYSLIFSIQLIYFLCIFRLFK